MTAPTSPSPVTHAPARGRSDPGRSSLGSGQSATPSLQIRTAAGPEDSAVIALYGRWVLERSAVLDADIKAAISDLGRAQRPVRALDLSGLEAMDTAGALLIVRLANGAAEFGQQSPHTHAAPEPLDPQDIAAPDAVWPHDGGRLELIGAAQSDLDLLDAVAANAHQEIAPAERRRARAHERRARPPARTPSIPGAWRGVPGLDDAVALLSVLGALGVAAGRTLANPWRFRATAFLSHVERVGLHAVPIVVLTCGVVGAVLMHQGAVQLARFGAEVFSINMLAILALRELGVLLCAIMVAGRSGSAFTAEIGAMKMREEIDAMRTLGIDPIDTLVVPRAAALVVVLPLLVMIGNVASLAGGAVVAVTLLDYDLAFYLDRLQATLTFDNLMVGLIKTPFIALAIALVGCAEGLRVAGSAASLGHQVTAAVVKAIFNVILIDAFFAIFLSAIGL